MFSLTLKVVQSYRLSFLPVTDFVYLLDQMYLFFNQCYRWYEVESGITRESPRLLLPIGQKHIAPFLLKRGL